MFLSVLPSEVLNAFASMKNVSEIAGKAGKCEWLESLTKPDVIFAFYLLLFNQVSPFSFFDFYLLIT